MSQKKPVKVKAALHIGANEETIRVAKSVIFAILNHKSNDHTKAVALEVFGKICEVKNVTVTNCSFVQ